MGLITRSGEAGCNDKIYHFVTKDRGTVHYGQSVWESGQGSQRTDLSIYVGPGISWFPQINILISRPCGQGGCELGQGSWRMNLSIFISPRISLFP